jgi:hypothetical protein
VNETTAEPSPEVEELWATFWAPIVAPGGVVDLDQVKKELYDFERLMDRAEQVYDAVTSGRISKCMTAAEAVIEVADEVARERTDSEILDELDPIRDEIHAAVVSLGILTGDVDSPALRAVVDDLAKLLATLNSRFPAPEEEMIGDGGS